MGLAERVLALITREGLIKKDERVLLAISGGIDSTALLYVLQEIQKVFVFQLGLAHVNHQLRGMESVRDEEFVKDLAAKFSLPFYPVRIDVRSYAREVGISIQHAGRELRYRFLNRIAEGEGYDRVATAHNLDDQVETFLLRVIKGTGIRGLASVPLTRERIIRPFLTTYRREILGYVEEKGIGYVEDSSNEKTVYERNYIRKYLTPVMEQLNPQFKEKVCLLLDDISVVNKEFEKRTGEFLNREVHVEDGEVYVDTRSLQGLDRETRFRILSAMIGKIDPSFVPLREHISLIGRLLAGERPNISIALPRGTRAKKVYNRLIFTKHPDPPVTTTMHPVAVGENRLEPFLLSLDISVSDLKPQRFPEDPNIAYFDAGKIGDVDLYIRTFADGDRFQPLGMKCLVKLKDFFISRKIPKAKRHHIPILMFNGDIAWIIGYRMDERYKIDENTRSVLKAVVKTFR